MACARQTLPLKGGGAWHFFLFFFLFGKENCHKRKNLLSPELKRRCAAAEGTMAVRCRLLLGENYIIPTQSISIRLCRGKMGKEALSMSQCQGQSDQAMTCGVCIRNGGLRSSWSRPTVCLDGNRVRCPSASQAC